MYLISYLIVFMQMFVAKQGVGKAYDLARASRLSTGAAPVQFRIFVVLI